MNNGFLTAHYGFKPLTQDGALSLGVKTVSVKNDNFLTSRESNNTAGSDDQFAALLREQKARNQNETKHDTPRKPQNETNNTNDKKVAFATQVSHSVAVQPAVPAVNDPSAVAVPSDLALDLIAFEGYLRQLIDESRDVNDGAGSDEALVQIDAIIESDASSLDKLIGLLGIFETSYEQDAPLSKEQQVASLLRLVDDLSSEQALLSGLTPQDLTHLQEQVQRYMQEAMDQREMDALEALVAQFVVLAAPTETDSAGRAQPAAAEPVPTVLLAAGSPAQDTSTKGQYQDRYDSRYELRYEGARQSVHTEGESTDKRNFDNVLKSSLNLKDMPALNSTNAQNLSSAERFLQSAALIAPFGTFGGTTDSTLTSTALVQQGTTALTSTLTNVVTQAQHASQPHPATQAVSMTISKIVKGGENTDIKLQLNPPELGRVDVKMSIDKDNMTKIVLTIEKPETYMMLQRDADALHRAMAEAGLDTQGDISFQLASEHEHSGNGRDGHNAHNGGAKGEQFADRDLIETVMDWHVDPQSGHVRYDILV